MVNWNIKEEVRKYRREYYEDNKDKYKIYKEREKQRPNYKRIKRESYYRNWEKNQLYREKNRIQFRKKAKEYYYKNKDRIKERYKKRFKKNKNNPNYIKQRREYFIRNKEKINKRNKEKYWKNIDYRIKVILKSTIKSGIKNNSKSKRTMELVGCSIPELKQHLEKQFTLGMNWKNYGFGWHIDHIRPCASFDLSKPEEQKKCFHYTNL